MITDIIDEFRILNSMLRKLKDHLLEFQPQHSVTISEFEEQIGYTPLSYSAELIADCWYHDGQRGKETRSRHGVICADELTVSLITDINQQKDRFRAVVKAAKTALDGDEWDAGLIQLGEVNTKLRESLRVSGLSRVHLKQIYRHIPMLAEAPYKVNFTWYVNGQSRKKISHDDAERMLIDLGEDKEHIQVQLSKLGALRPTDQLIQVQKLAPTARANLVFKDGKEIRRKAMNCPLPLFVPMQALPQVKQIPLDPPPGRVRSSRGDNSTDDEAYLPSLRVFVKHES